jgi:hydrogenase expression/formation protein HypC
MCLAIPGQIVEIQGGDDPMQRTGRVKFGGIVKEVNLAYTPQATVDDYVLVHVGFSLSIVDEDEAKKVFEYLDEMQELDELDELEEAGRQAVLPEMTPSPASAPETRSA